MPCAVFAGGEVQINDLKGSWKNPAMSYCNTSNMGNASIGRYKELCVGNYKIDANSPSQCVLGDDMGVLMLVAREVNDRGARFCVTTIYAEHERKGKSWTLYAESAQGVQPCYWLCKPGYSGEGCNSNTSTSTSCDSAPLLRENFDNYTMARDPQVESVIPMFHWNEYKGCGLNSSQEHDMILAVSDWLPSGHGVWASPYVVHARREDYKSRKGGIDVWPAGEATLLCKSGYTANTAGNDCVAVNEAECALSQTCANWPSNAYDESTMVVEYNENQNCYQFRCKEAGYAFPSTADRTCQPCTENLRGGASPADGTCIKCEEGQIFDADAASSGYCSPADSYSQSDLQYGSGQNKSTTLADQCWMIPEATEYTNCVKGIK